VVHGEYDAAVLIAHAEFVAERLKYAELHRFEADHSLVTGPDADRSTRTVRTFVDRITTSTEQTTQ
jgi:dipeptidyl aminopeptidase/acylaminoacyl peptidase